MCKMLVILLRCRCSMKFLGDAVVNLWRCGLLVHTEKSAWISNYIHYEVQGETPYPFPDCSRWNLKKDMKFHPTFCWACGYLSMPGLLVKVVPDKHQPGDEYKTVLTNPVPQTLIFTNALTVALAFHESILINEYLYLMECLTPI